MTRPSAFRWLLATSSLVLIVATVAGEERAESSDWEAAHVKALEAHRAGAPDALVELSIVRDLERVATQTDSWLPDFWSAYVLTQVVMSHPKDRHGRLTQAHRRLDRAFSRLEDGAPPVADLFALRSLIHTFEKGQAASREASEEIGRKAAEALEQAFETGPDRPVVMVMAGTEAIRSGQREGSWAGVLSGAAALQVARRAFEEAQSPQPLTSHFNEEWIEPWLDWVERMKAGGLETE